jgi:Zn finger protein HypA/HybF involved in hydrogenase expression
MCRFSNWYQKVTCKHTILTFERIDYQDRYVKCKCDKCGEDVYKDI